ncbi:MAG: AAA family ATPase [Cyclobacteriaceae bacterium]
MFDATSLDLVLQAYRELYPDLNIRDCYLFFDEIQNVDGWEKFIRRVYDQETQNIFVTGANSKLLSSEEVEHSHMKSTLYHSKNTFNLTT